ncbi:MAG: helix-turn-helix transcriptional regulator [Chloroflexi bacterium]|nr:helix-turn-helix transcriptional regulator [Chloroflexota bacterium]
MEDVKTQYGRAIRKRRHELGWSQEYLASQANLHRTYVADVERGERNISLENIIKLSVALDLTPGEFFTQYYPQEDSREQ